MSKDTKTDCYVAREITLVEELEYKRSSLIERLDTVNRAIIYLKSKEGYALEQITNIVKAKNC